MPTIDLLRDSIWQFWGVVVGVIGVALAVAAIIIETRQRRRKRLTYEILAKLPLVHRSQLIHRKLKVLFDGEEVTDVDTFVIRLQNTGNSAIVPTDYIEPVSISFPKSTRILDAFGLSSVIDQVPPALEVTNSKVVFPSILLNRGWYVDVAVFVSGFADEAAVTGKIVDVHDIQQRGLARSVRFPRLDILALTGAGLGVVLGFSYWTGNPTLVSVAWGAILAAVFIYAGGFFWLWLNRRRQHR